MLRYFCVIFVMIHHLQTNSQLSAKIYEPFFLNGFIFLSGYTYTHREGYRNFVLNKARQLLIPCFFFGLLIIITGNIFTPAEHEGILKDLLWFFLQIREKNDAMWFAAAMFTGYLCFYWLIERYLKMQDGKDNDGKLILLLFALYLLEIFYEYYFPNDLFPWHNNRLPWHLEYLPTMMFFMFSGYLYRHKYEKPEKKPYLLLVISGVLFYFYVFSDLDDLLQVSIPGNILFRLIGEMLGLPFFICLSKVLKPNRIMMYIGQNSLIYFGIAHYINVPLQLLFARYFHDYYLHVLEIKIYRLRFSLVFAVISSLIIMIPVYIINTYFPFIMGRKPNR